MMKFAKFTFCCAFLLSCASASKRSTLDFIGGQLATVEDFPSTMLLDLLPPLGSCGGAKINDIFIISAGHCVRALHENMRRGNRTFEAHIGVQASDFRTVTIPIDSIFLPDNFIELFFRVGDQQAILDAADVGLIRIGPFEDPEQERAFGSVPNAILNFDPVGVGTSIAIGGYGCNATGRGATRELFFAPSSIIAVHDRGNVLIADDSTGQFCAGDSGGPVYLMPDSGPFRQIVGVNSFTSPQRLETTNGIARIDTESSSRAGEWIQRVLRGEVTFRFAQELLSISILAGVFEVLQTYDGNCFLSSSELSDVDLQTVSEGLRSRSFLDQMQFSTINTVNVTSELISIEGINAFGFPSTLELRRCSAAL